MQIANPIEEEKLKRAIQQISEQRLGSAITDIGGGGLSCGVCETADKYDLGIDVDLDKIPLKAANMAPWEIWISESQERMLSRRAPEESRARPQDIQGRADGGERHWSLQRFGRSEAHLQGYPRCQHRPQVTLQPAEDDEDGEVDATRSSWSPIFEQPKDLGAVLLKLLAGYNIASKEKVVRRYDQEVKGQTVVKPMQGWNAGPSDGAVVKPLVDSMIGISISLRDQPAVREDQPLLDGGERHRRGYKEQRRSRAGGGSPSSTTSPGAAPSTRTGSGASSRRARRATTSASPMGRPSSRGRTASSTSPRWARSCPRS